MESGEKEREYTDRNVNTIYTHIVVVHLLFSYMLSLSLLLDSCVTVVAILFTVCRLCSSYSDGQG